MDHPSQVSRLPLRAVGASWRVSVFAALLLIYVILTLGVIWYSPLITMDKVVWQWNLRGHYPSVFPWLNTYVMLGQRAPATMAALPWFIWISWRYRTARPLLLLGTALVVLNLSVGVVKLATGRRGPRQTHNVHDIFAGGDIFPSGHTANTVVLYGVIAMVAVMLRLRWHRLVCVAAAFLAVSVGLSTVYLDTHWLTDVIGGWFAGVLVLLVLPPLLPKIERCWDWLVRRLRPRSQPRHAARSTLAPVPPAENIEPEQKVGPDGKIGPDEHRVPAQL